MTPQPASFALKGENMSCEFNITNNDEVILCIQEDECMWPSCESSSLNPASFPLGPPTINDTMIKKDVGLR